MIDIHPVRLALAFLMAVVPLGVFLWFGVPLVSRTLMALVRMVVQLLFVGLYLKVVFDLVSFVVVCCSPISVLLIVYASG